MELAKEDLKSKNIYERLFMKQFVLCINNSGYDDIQKWKIYQVVEPNDKTDKGWIRLIDDSGEDYLYPPDYFEFIEIPQKIQEAMAA